MARLSLSLHAVKPAPDKQRGKRPSRGLQSRLIRVFAVQATLVSVATMLGVYAAYMIAEDYLVHQALQGEASHYWTLWEEEQAYPLPNTANMHAFMSTPGSSGILPRSLDVLSDDYYGRVSLDGKHPLVLVSENQGYRLFLVFKEEQVSRLAFFFGIAPLTVVLILIYIASWLTFRQSQRLISPVTQLARIVDTMSVRDVTELPEKLAPFGGIDADIDALVDALNHYTERLQAFVEREQSFTRDASHELRTPLAVMRGSLDILQTQMNPDARQARVLDRMRATVRDMESLIETLLFLAREDNLELIPEPVLVNPILPQVVTQVKEALGCADVPVTIQEDGDLMTQAPERVFQIIATNLLRNALQHGQGQPVEVRVGVGGLQVRDSGPGMTPDELKRAFQPFYRAGGGSSGYGLGLAIVKRLCDRFGWQLQAESAPGKGTFIRVDPGPPPA